MTKLTLSGAAAALLALAHGSLHTPVRAPVHPVHDRAVKLKSALARCLDVRAGNLVRRRAPMVDYDAIQAANAKRARKAMKLAWHASHWPQNRRQA